jgi:hypothetical protein
MPEIKRKKRKANPKSPKTLKANKVNRLAFEFTVITTSFHEAGHALSALLNFGYVHCVSLQISKNKKTPEYLGEARYDGAANLGTVSDPDLINWLVLSDITIYQSGLASEKIFYKEICGTSKVPYIIKEGSQIDFSYVSEIVKKYDLAPPGKKRYLFKNKMFRATQHLLQENWGDVIIIAHALFQSRKLTHLDLKSLLLRKSINKKFWKEQFKNIELLNNNTELTDSQIKKIIKL